MTAKRFVLFLLKYGLLAVALLATAGLSALATMRVVLESQEVVVPSLLERKVPEAAELAVRHRLTLRVEGRKNDPRVPADRIVTQEPSAGELLKTDRSIRVWVSLGPRRLKVPRVEGETLRTARLMLEQAQVPLGRVVEVEDASAAGTILVQHPPAGDTQAAEAVSLLISQGTVGVDYVMPDLIGHPAQEALNVLRRAGVKIGAVSYRSYPGVAPGVVLRQDPPAGHRLAAQGSVSLDVSRQGE
ncbi:MAG TPA: PASTA domain-containing protein [Vicinamibacteria bacterium]